MRLAELSEKLISPSKAFKIPAGMSDTGRSQQLGLAQQSTRRMERMRGSTASQMAVGR